MIKKKKHRWMFLLGLILSQGSCINIPSGKNDASHLFYLETQKSASKTWEGIPKVSWQLFIEEPETDARLDTDRVIINKGNGEVTHAHGIRWVERLPLLILQLLFDLFDQSQKIKGVGSALDSIDADYILLIDVKTFEFMPCSKEVRIRLNAKLMDAQNREIVGGKTFQREISVLDESMDHVMSAFIQSINEVGRDLVRWTLTCSS